MPMQWNDQADARLFANVLKLHVVKLDYSRLARAMGETVTAKAISHRIAKIKEKANMHVLRDPGSSSGGSSVRRRTAGKGKFATAGGARGGGGDVDDVEVKVEDMDEDEGGDIKFEDVDTAAQPAGFDRAVAPYRQVMADANADADADADAAPMSEYALYGMCSPKAGGFGELRQNHGQQARSEGQLGGQVGDADAPAADAATVVGVESGTISIAQ